MKKLILIGNPVEQSLSPQMHNAALGALNLPLVYEKILVLPEELEQTIDMLRNELYAGANVTIPYKSACIPFLDKVDESAEKIGAVNTIVKEGSQLVGYNTDGTGFVRGLKETAPFPLDNGDVLVIGAGGAARGIVSALLAERVRSIAVCNRTYSKAEELVADVASSSLQALTLEKAESHLNRYSIIINTTSVGMFPHTEKMPLRLGTLRQQAVVSDIIYNPFETQLLAEAKKRDAIIDNGVSMFVYQGALAFEKWTGIFPDTAIMRDKVTEELRRKLC
ncbi:shikimate dehydrogenase [Fictibacillus iocasae]|uniref:Shikimate dehydrogenase (NADP(+)) n=1 Tax=Fictibacillus iocasae TaxID=2715437 RepID=A0ABW2NTP7_9BACL